jgi:hypothetical protein
MGGHSFDRLVRNFDNEEEQGKTFSMKTGDIIGGIFTLILVFLLVSQSQGVSTVLSSFATGGSQLITVLQGR